MFKPVLNRFQTIQEDRGSTRLDLWEEAFRVFDKSPIVGVGCDNFKFRVGGAMSHSVYIGTLVELGMVGFALLLCWIAVLLRKAWKSEDRLWIFPLLTSYLCQAAFLHEFYFSCFWLALGLVEGARPGARQRRQRHPIPCRIFHPTGSSFLRAGTRDPQGVAGLLSEGKSPPVAPRRRPRGCAPTGMTAGASKVSANPDLRTPV
jgi:hypothetical protein